MHKIFIVSFFCFISQAFSHGDGLPLRNTKELPKILERLIFEVEFKSENLKSNESSEGRIYGDFLPMAHPEEMSKIRNYFNSFYFPRGYYILRIDTDKIGRENILWREHINLPIYGEFFAKIPKEAIIDLSVWVKSDSSEIVKLAERIPYQWVLEDSREDKKDYITAPYKLKRRLCMRSYGRKE